MIINFKKDDGYEVIINMNNVTHIIPNVSGGGYTISFIDDNYMYISWKEFERLTKAIEVHGG